MKTILVPLLATLMDLLRSRASLQLEVLALRQQLSLVADRDRKRLSFHKSERIFWVWLYRLWPACLQTLKIFKQARSFAGIGRDFGCTGPGSLAHANVVARLLLPMCAS